MDISPIYKIIIFYCQCIITWLLSTINFEIMIYMNIKWNIYTDGDIKYCMIFDTLVNKWCLTSVKYKWLYFVFIQINSHRYYHCKQFENVNRISLNQEGQIWIHIMTHFERGEIVSLKCFTLQFMIESHIWSASLCPAMRA